MPRPAFLLADLVREPRQHARQIVSPALIGAVLASISGAVLYVGGFATPHRLTPQRIVNAFEANAGVHPGFRRIWARHFSTA